MAISQPEYTFLSLLAQSLIFPENPSVLEFGEQHWHGDVKLEDLFQDINAFAFGERHKKLLNDLDEVLKRKDTQKNFDLAKIVYQLFLNYQSICAIDLHGTSQSLQFDLNYEVSLDTKFDVTINLGTAEHIFNVFQFFKTVHECTNSNGIMLHVMPFLGWIDHGFFNFQPTFYWDLAEANLYQVKAFLFINGKKFVSFHNRQAVTQYLHQLQVNPSQCPVIPSNSYVALQQSSNPSDFKIPMQKFFQITPEEYWSLTKQI